MERMFLLDMAFEIRNLPEPVIVTAGMAMFHENPLQMEWASALLDHVLTQPGTDEMSDAINALSKQFVDTPPPGYDDMTKEQAHKLAKASMALGAIIELHDTLEDYIEHTIIAIVDGTKNAIENFGNFVSEHE